ncbi:hypothetical protein TWF694_003910 [Orbilia ellipsospora]
MNRSAYSYVKFREAGDRLSAAQNDLHRSKAENLAFPKAHDRSYIRYNAAKQEYDKALKERDDAAGALDRMLSKLAYRSDGLEVSEHPPITAFTSIEPTNILISHTRGSESGVENYYEESGNLSILIQEITKENLAIRETIQGIRRIVEDIQTTQKCIRLDITRLDQNYHSLQLTANQATSQSNEEFVYKRELEASCASITGQVGDLGVDIGKNRQALEFAEKAFDKIYQRLEIAEELQRVEHPPCNVSAIKDLDERLNNIEDLISTVQEMQARVQSFHDNFLKNEPASNSQTYLQKLRGEIQENIMSKMAPLEENVSSKLKQYSESLARIDILANDLGQQRQALDTVRNTVTRIEEANSSIHGKTAAVDDQVRGLIMTVQHINKKFDEFSVDEIVMKINLSLRNASDKSVQALTNQIQGMSRTLLEKMDVVEQFERRLRVIENITYPAANQNIDSLPTS